MAKMTMLEIVQDILNDMSGDKVNSIFDTEESEQVAQIVATTYKWMVSNRDWLHTRKLIQLTPYTEPTKPTHAYLDSDVKRLEVINYNKRKSGDNRDKFEEVYYKEPDAFLRLLNQRNNSEADVDSIVDDSGVTLNIKNDKAPEYYTSFDDDTLIFDSYDNVVDSSIQGSKVQAIGYVIPRIIVDDDFTPVLPEEAFGELVESSKTRAQAKLRQFEDVLSAREAQKQSNWNARNAWRVKGGTKYPDYGRHRGRERNPTFRQDRS